MPLIEDEDPFWRVQLVNNTGEARRPFTSEAPRFDYQDHALPVGTDVTDTSLAGILGREREVCVPVTSGIISVNAYDDDDDHDNSNNNASNSSSGSGSSDSSDNNRGWLGQALVLKLRQVNGDGVMSGVGGDIWCAALLLSAWLLENPEVVRGLDVLELGSGLGLCGITAGYLAKSVMLTDYVGELLVNLRHNVEVNRTPRVVSTVAPRKPIEHRRSRSGLKEDADHAPATGPHRGRPELQRCGRQRDGQRQQQQQQQQQQTSEPEHQQHLQIDDLREKTMAEITSRQRHHRVPDGDAPSDTVGRVGSPGRRDLERRGHKENSPVRISAAATANDAVVVSDGRDFLPPPPQATPLLPLSRADVRKLDWTTYAGDGEAGRASGGKEGGGGWWWDDRGPDTSQSGVMVPIGPQLPESDSLRCDVAIGSALVYSPHHACVADVMSHLFDEKGGCRAAYVVQLSTRPGFDDFLHRLGACGLHYRLQRISAVLPVAVLDEIRQTARGAAIGGPVTRTTDLAVALGADDDDSDCQDDSNDRTSDNDMGGQGEASGFDEFVLCSVFRSRDSTSRGEGAKSTR